MHKPFRLYHGDCIETLKNLPASCVDLIFADPPYKLSNGGFTCQSGQMVSVNKGQWDKSNGIEADHAFNSEWIAACKRVLKPNGSIWISGTYHSIYSCGFALQTLDYHILNEIIWFKPNASPNLSCRFFTASHETLIWARADKKGKHTFHYEAMRAGDFPQDRLKIPGKQMRSVWSIGSTPKEEKTYGRHPTQKPLQLLERIILASSSPDDVVLDPFSGSGTTGVAAIKHGRKYVGIETNAEYIDLSRQRLEDAAHNSTMTRKQSHEIPPIVSRETQLQHCG
jgi:site-specific DNA-methyltransferase (adenine-specific)